MRKNKFYYLGFSLFTIIILVVVVFCIKMVFKNNDAVLNTCDSSYVKLKFGHNEVEEITINSEDILSGNYFDFVVFGSAICSDITYDIYMLSDFAFKIELYDITGNINQSNLSYIRQIDNGNYLVYTGSIKAGEVLYGKKYRLRFIDLDLNDLDNTKTVKIKILSEQNV